MESKHEVIEKIYTGLGVTDNITNSPQDRINALSDVIKSATAYRDLLIGELAPEVPNNLHMAVKYFRENFEVLEEEFRAVAKEWDEVEQLGGGDVITKNAVLSSFYIFPYARNYLRLLDTELQKWIGTYNE